jgi:hypothetical protein
MRQAMGAMQAKRVRERLMTAFVSRGLIGACLAILFVLQGLAAAQGAAAHADRAASASAFAPICLTHDAGPDGAPTERHHPFRCCFFCGPADVDVFAGRPLWRASQRFAPSIAAAPIRPATHPAPNPRLSGWATSWSSQAPPLFS